MGSSGHGEITGQLASKNVIYETGSLRLTRARVLAKDLSRPVYTLDLRNHGDSSHSPVHDYTSMSVDVEHFIKDQNIQKPTLIGHSMGAKVAMAMALRQPLLYSGICPVDNSPIDAALKSDFGMYVTAMREVEEKKARKQSEADQILQKYDIELTIRQFLLTNFVRQKDGSYAFRVPLQTLAKSLPAMADFPFRDPDEARFEGPTLFVRGTESHYVADETLPLIGRFFPKFELLSLKCGHWVMSERFEDFRAGFVDWVNRCVDGNEK